VAVGGLEREVHVLERQRQRQLSRELPLEIRCNLAACHGDPLRRERDQRVVHQLQSRPGPDRADPDGALTERVEQGPGRRGRAVPEIVGMPARNALVAIAWPIAPVPSTATGSCRVPITAAAPPLC
jgi:hypothetical protein